MNPTIVKKIEEAQMKKVPALRPGDVVRVHQKIKEGNKERVQVFEGVVLKVTGSGLKETFLVRKISFGVGIEKSYLIHSPNIAKIEVKKRSKVRQGYLTYLRKLTGKSARLKDKQFDMLAVNVAEEKVEEPKPEDKKEEKKADENLDAEITELSEEQIADAEKEEVSLDEIAEKEEKQAEKEDREGSEKAEEGGQAAEKAEVGEGVKRAEEETPGQATEGKKAEKTEEQKEPEKEE